MNRLKDGCLVTAVDLRQFDALFTRMEVVQ